MEHWIDIIIKLLIIVFLLKLISGITVNHRGGNEKR